MGASRYWQILAAIILATQPAFAGPLPTKAEAKKIILANKQSLFRDPDSIKGGPAIGDPYFCPMSDTPCVCVELNMTNAYGGYTGLIRYGIRLGPVAPIGVMGPYIKCGRFTPFPELVAKRQ